MKKTHIEKLREEIAADPALAAEFAAIERKLRPACLKLSAWHEAIFPPESPTSARRGGNKLALTPELMDAVCAILDARMGRPCELAASDFAEAMKSADPAFFRMMAEAAQYVRDMPEHARSLFTKHVVAARCIAAAMMGKSGPLPSKAAVKAEVMKGLGQFAYGDASAEWSRVWAAAGLKDLPR